MTLIVRGTDRGGLSVTGSLPAVARLSGRRLTRGFAAPPHGGFALIGNGLTYDSRRAQVLPQGPTGGFPAAKLGRGSGGELRPAEAGLVVRDPDDDGRESVNDLVFALQHEQLTLTPDAGEGAPMDRAGAVAVEGGEMLGRPVALVAGGSAPRGPPVPPPPQPLPPGPWPPTRRRHAGRAAGGGRRGRHRRPPPHLVEAGHAPDARPPGPGFVAVGRRQKRRHAGDRPGLLVGDSRRDLYHALLADPGRPARELAQVIELCAAHAAPARQLHPLDARGVQRERALDAHAVRDAPHREGGAGALAALADHDPLEQLGALLFALHDLHVHPNGVTGAEPVAVLLELRSLHQPDGVHEVVPFPSVIRSLGLLAPFEAVHEPPLVLRQVRALEQIRAGPPRPIQRLHPAPALDVRVVAREQHRRHPRAPELFRPRVLRGLEQAAGARLPLGAAPAAQHPGQE